MHLYFVIWRIISQLLEAKIIVFPPLGFQQANYFCVTAFANYADALFWDKYIFSMKEPIIAS